MQNEPFWNAKGVLLKNRDKTKEKKGNKMFLFEIIFIFLRPITIT